MQFSLRAFSPANVPPLASCPLQFLLRTTRAGARTRCLCRARPASISPSTTMSSVSRASSRARQLPVKLGTCLSSRGTQGQTNESCIPNLCVKTTFLFLVAMQGHHAKPGNDALGRRLARPRADKPPEGAASSPPHGLGNSQPLKTAKSKWLLDTSLPANFPFQPRERHGGIFY